MEQKPIALTLCENLRTASYIPFYLSHAGGYWQDAGLQITLWTAPDPSVTAEALLDGRIPVSWGGPMRVMMHHDKDPDCPLVCFAQVVARDPFFLIGRDPCPDFRFRDLIGPKVAITAEVPTPWMLLQEDLRRAGLNPADLDRAPANSMQGNAEALRAGHVDVVQLFEPYADDLVAAGHGHVWHRASERGDVAFTSFYSTRQFIEAHRETCIRLVHGTAKALQALNNRPAAEIAPLIAPFFPDRAHASLVRIIENFRRQKLWPQSPELPADAFVRLKGALLSGGLIHRDVPYYHVVDHALSSAKPH